MGHLFNGVRLKFKWMKYMLLPSLGLKVRDNESMNSGVIIDVNYWVPGVLSPVNHGTLAVELKTNEGHLYTEHYAIYGWDTHLTVLE
jgi:hypothetical protein